MRRTRTQRGQATVETGLVIGLLVLVVLGIIELGWLFFAINMVTNAARDGARIASALQNRGTCGNISDTSSIPPLVTGELGSIVNVDGSTSNGCTCSAGVCIDQCKSDVAGTVTCPAIPTAAPCPVFSATDIPVVRVTVAGHVADIFGIFGNQLYPFCRSVTFRDEGR
jgi:Flp pilus assembly protein TadG